MSESSRQTPGKAPTVTSAPAAPIMTPLVSSGLGQTFSPFGNENTRRALEAALREADALKAKSAARSGEVSNAMEELRRRVGTDGKLRDLVRQWYAMKGGSEERGYVLPRGLDLSQDTQRRRALLEAQLGRLGLTLGDFERLLRAFVKAFNAAAVDFALGKLDEERKLVRSYLRDRSALNALAEKMVQALSSRRQELLATPARTLTEQRSQGFDSSDFDSPTARVKHVELLKKSREHVLETATGIFVDAKLPLFVRAPDFRTGRVLDARNATEAADYLAEFFPGYAQDLDRTYESIEQEPLRIYKLPAFMADAKREFDIPESSGAALVLAYEARKASEMPWSIRLLLIGALVLGGVAMMAVGTVVAPIAMSADAVLALPALKNTFDDYTRDRHAYRARMGADPTVLWWVLSLVSALLAVYGTSRLFKEMARIRALREQIRALPARELDIPGAPEQGAQNAELGLRAGEIEGRTPPEHHTRVPPGTRKVIVQCVPPGQRYISYVFDGRTFFVFDSVPEATNQIAIMRALAKAFRDLSDFIEPTELIWLDGRPTFSIGFAGRDATQHLSDGFAIDPSWTLNAQSIRDLSRIEHILVTYRIPGLRLAVDDSGRVSIVGASKAPVFGEGQGHLEHAKQIAALRDAAEGKPAPVSDPFTEPVTVVQSAQEQMRLLVRGELIQIQELQAEVAAIRAHLVRVGNLSEIEADALRDLYQIHAELNSFAESLSHVLASMSRGELAGVVDGELSKLHTIVPVAEITARLERIIRRLSQMSK